MALSSEVLTGLKASPPNREAIVAFLDILADPGNLTADDSAQLGKMTVKLCNDITDCRGVDECERIGLVYVLVMLLIGNSAPALANEGIVCQVTSLLSSLALSGLALWTERGWLSELVEGGPMKLAVANSMCHAALVEEIQRTRKRGARLGKLLSQNKNTILAAIKWKERTEAHGGGAGNLGGSGDGLAEVNDDTLSLKSGVVADASSLPSVPTTPGGSVSNSEQHTRLLLDRHNLFSPAALRHSALAALAVVHTHCARSSSSGSGGGKQTGAGVGLRNAFLSSGGLECALALSYVPFGEAETLLSGEKEAVANGSVDYSYVDDSSGGVDSGDTQEDGAGRGGTGASSSSSSSSSSSTATNKTTASKRASSSSVLRKEFQRKVAAEAEKAEEEAQCLVDQKTMPSLTDQARAHLNSASLLSNAHQTLATPSPLVHGKEEEDSGGGNGSGGDEQRSVLSGKSGQSGQDLQQLQLQLQQQQQQQQRRRLTQGDGSRGAERCWASRIRPLAQKAKATATASALEQPQRATTTAAAALGRRTCFLAEALLCQFNCGDLVQLQCLRASTARKLQAAAAAAATAATVSSAALLAPTTTSFESSITEDFKFHFHHPLAILDKCKKKGGEGLPPSSSLKRLSKQQQQQQQQSRPKGKASTASATTAAWGSGAAAAAARRRLGLMAQLRHPHCALFQVLAAPLEDCVREKSAAEHPHHHHHHHHPPVANSSSSPPPLSSLGAATSAAAAAAAAAGATTRESRGGGGDGVTRVLKADARQARRNAKDQSLGLWERLACAVAGARIESVAKARADQVAQQRALGVYGRATAARALLEVSTASAPTSLAAPSPVRGGGLGGDGGGGCGGCDGCGASEELALRLATNLVGLVQKRADAEEKRAAPQVHARREISDDDEDDEVSDGDGDGEGDGNNEGCTGEEAEKNKGSRGNESRQRRRRRRRSGRKSTSKSAERTDQGGGKGGLPVVSVEQMRAGLLGRVESEVERRLRRTAERRFEVANREHILEAREALEANRLGMVVEEKRSVKVAQREREVACGLLTEAKLERARLVASLAEASAEDQRRGRTEGDLKAKAWASKQAEAAAQTKAAEKLEAKKRAQAELLRVADVRFNAALEAEGRQAAKEAERLDLGYRKQRKEAAAALVVAVRAWRKASGLHSRRGSVYRSKTEVVQRLHHSGGGFKLIDGELRWRDEDYSNGWYEQGDPRQHKEAHAGLKALLTPGLVKPWKWKKSERPEPPPGLPEEEQQEQRVGEDGNEEEGKTKLGGIDKQEEGGQSLNAHHDMEGVGVGGGGDNLIGGSEDEMGNSDEEDEDAEGAQQKRGWAQGQVYSSG